MTKIDGNNKATIQAVFDVVKMNKADLKILNKKFDDFVATNHELQLQCTGRFASIEQKQTTEKEFKDAYVKHKKDLRNYKIIVITLLIAVLGSLGSLMFACTKLIQTLNGG